MNLNHYALAVIASALSLNCTGCPVLTQACAKALPVLNQTTTIAQDAAQAVAQAQTYIDALPPDLRAKAAPILERAREALRAAAKVSNDAATACVAPDPITQFAAFVKAWNDLKPFLTLFGGANGAIQAAVADPIVVGMAAEAK